MSNFCVGLFCIVWYPKKFAIRAGSLPMAFDTLKIFACDWNNIDPELEQSSKDRWKWWLSLK